MGSARWESGALIGQRFRLLEPLGRGGFGAVHRALDEQSGGHVALKQLHVADPGALPDLKRGFRSLSRVVPRNLVTLFELHLEFDAPFFPMELIDGVPLLNHVYEQGPAPPDTATWPTEGVGTTTHTAEPALDP